MKMFRSVLFVLFALGFGFLAMQTVACGTKAEPTKSCKPACATGEVCKEGACVKQDTGIKKCDPACATDKECKEGKCVEKTTSKPAP